MATQPLSHGLILGNALHLTPDLFHELDATARDNGVVLFIYSAADMGRNFAELAKLGDALYYDRLPSTESTPHHFDTIRPKYGVNLSNCIDLDAFRACPRPEMDWSAIAPEDVYHFLAWHEIHHCRFRDGWLMGKLSNYIYFDIPLYDKDDKVIDRAWRAVGKNRLAYKSFQLFTEARADRAAWESVYPGRSFPKKAEAMPASDLEAIHEQYAVLLDRYQRMEPIEALPHFPRLVPAHHVKEWFTTLWSLPVSEAMYASTPSRKSSTLRVAA